MTFEHSFALLIVSATLLTANLFWHRKIANLIDGLSRRYLLRWYPRRPVYFKSRRNRRIAIDIRPAQNQFLGVGHWIEGWVSKLPDVHTSNEYVLVSSALKHGPPSWAIDLVESNPRFKSLHVRLPNLVLSRVSEHRSFDLLSKVAGRLHAYQANDSLVYRPTGGKSITAVYDEASWLDQADDHRNPYMRSAREKAVQADLCFTLTDAMKRLLVKEHGFDDRRIVVAPGAARDDMTPHSRVAAESALRPFFDAQQLPNYVLYTGGLANRKNIARMLAAFQVARRATPALQFWFAGVKSEELRKAFGENENVRGVGYVEQRLMPFLYSGAIGLVYASLHEGFGLPIVEAMACGTPVITTKSKVTEEVAGDIPFFVDPYSVEDIARGMTQVVSGSDAARQASARGTSWAARFSFAKTASIIAEAWDRLFEGAGVQDATSDRRLWGHART